MEKEKEFKEEEKSKTPKQEESKKPKKTFVKSDLA